uniref:CSON013646 protein n=1 Tax=Culicoides sonorensis TaxID=179676 RepID=A0A336LI98_CULSO
MSNKIKKSAFKSLIFMIDCVLLNKTKLKITCDNIIFFKNIKNYYEEFKLNENHDSKLNFCLKLCKRLNFGLFLVPLIEQLILQK